MSARWPASKIFAVVEGGSAALLLALGLLLLISARRAAEWATKTYGHNVDSGAIEGGVGTLLILLAALLALSACSLWFRWRGRSIVQILVAAAIVWFVRFLLSS